MTITPSATALGQKIQLLELLCIQLSALKEQEDHKVMGLDEILKKYPHDDTYHQQHDQHQKNSEFYRIQISNANDQINLLKQQLRQLGC